MKTYEIQLPELPEAIRETHHIVFWWTLPSVQEAKDAYGLLMDGKWAKAQGAVWRGIAAVPKAWSLANEVDTPLPFAVKLRGGLKVWAVAYCPQFSERPWTVRLDSDGTPYTVSSKGICDTMPDFYDVIGLWEEEKTTTQQPTTYGEKAWENMGLNRKEVE